MLLSANAKPISVETAFNLPIKGKTVMGLDDMFNPAIPSQEPDYSFPTPVLISFLAFMEYPDDSGYWLHGMHGTGKTSFVKQVCNRLNWACYSVNGSSTLEIEDLLYQNVIRPDGTTGIELNALAKAFSLGGVFLFNEIDLVDPSRLAGLNEILAGDTLIIPGYDEILQKSPEFRFVVTANTNGSFDDESGIDFVGTGTMNIAFMDRFIVSKVDYLPPKIEQEYLESFALRVHSNLWSKSSKESAAFLKRIKPIISKMIGVANESRKAASNGADFDRPISMRGLKRWVQKSIQYDGAPSPLKMALSESITNAYPKSQADAIVRFCKDAFGSNFS